MIRRSNTGHYSSSHSQSVYGRYQSSTLSIKRNRNLSLCLVFVGYLLIWILLQLHVTYYNKYYQHGSVESTTTRPSSSLSPVSSSSSSPSFDNNDQDKKLIENKNEEIANTQDRNNSKSNPYLFHIIILLVYLT